MEEAMKPLHAAVNNGDLGAVRKLVESGSDINSVDSFGRTPLHLAAFDGFIDIVNYLIEYGANVLVRDNNGSIPLVDAAWMGHVNVVKLLIDHGSAVNNADVQQALISSFYDNGINCAPILLEAGAKIGIVETIFLEIRYLLTAFLNFGYNINLLYYGNTLLSHAVNAYALRRVDLVKYLLSMGAEPNIQNSQGETALMIAIKWGYPEIVQILLQGGADVTIKRNDGKTALDLATEDSGNIELVKILVNSLNIDFALHEQQNKSS